MLLLTTSRVTGREWWLSCKKLGRVLSLLPLGLVPLIVLLSGCGQSMSALDSTAIEASLPREILRPLPPGLQDSAASAARDLQNSDHESAVDRHPGIDLNSESTADDYIRFALLNSPAVAAASNRWQSLVERIPQVGSLPNPSFNFGYFAQEVETRVGPQDARVALRQAFPWPGTLAVREHVAESTARAAWRRLEAEQLSIAQRVWVALHELSYLDSAIVITGENLELLRTFEDVVRTRYRTGVGSHPALIQSQVEIGLIEDRVAQLVAMRPSLLEELNAALNRPPRTSLGTVPSLPAIIVADSFKDLAEQSRLFNPDLLALDEERTAAHFRTGLAQRKGYPDFTLGLDYIFTGKAQNSVSGSGDDPILLTVGVSVPLWRGKINAGIREAKAQARSVSERRIARQNDVAAALQRAWFLHFDAHRRVSLYRDNLIPKATESLMAMLSSFKTGSVDLLPLLDTQRILLEFKIAQARANADRGKALSRIQRLVGQKLKTASLEETSPQGDK